jgi:hypothetical protein
MWLEGAPTVVLAFGFWYFMADEPSKAKYLTAEERALLLARLNRQTGMTASAQELHREDVKKGLLDWKVWTFSFAQFGVDTMVSCFLSSTPATASSEIFETRLPPFYLLTIALKSFTDLARFYRP